MMSGGTAGGSSAAHTHAAVSEPRSPEATIRPVPSESRKKYGRRRAQRLKVIVRPYFCELAERYPMSRGTIAAMAAGSHGFGGDAAAIGALEASRTAMAQWANIDT
jgi:hypothetical protein